jgi:hypothetical protein
MAMMRLKVEEIGPGLHPNEAVVRVRTATGVERLVVPRQSISQNSIEIAWPTRSKEKLYLVEFPRETQSGAWRAWVPIDQFLEHEERKRA